MLARLSIRDFAIIDRLDVELEPGFSVVTGETGAGKSILVNALHLLLGGRASEDMIRSESDSAEVQGVFRLPPGGQARLAELELADGEQMLVRRVVSRSGRNRIFVNDRPVTLAVLAELTRDQVDISGQHEHVGLTDEERHLEILDDFGGLGAERARVADAVSRFRELDRACEKLARLERQRAEREDYLRYSLERIRQVDPRPGEDEELALERSRLANAEKIAAGLGAALGGLYEADGSAVEQLGRARKALQELTRFVPELEAAVSQLEGCQQSLEDLSRELEVWAARSESDPARLDAVEQRLGAIKALVRLHGPDLSAVLGWRAELEAELGALDESAGEKAALDEARTRAHAQALALARALGERREAVAAELAARLRAELDTLAMPGAVFDVQIEHLDDAGLDERGLDSVRFMLSANPGEAARPLSKVASGGELSRVLLAVKSVLVDADRVSSYVFDEVDAGVGGATAEVIGRKLAAVARGHQVVCITHLPQIAAWARRHYSVHKRQVKGRTVSGIARLDGEAQRVEELARMLGGQRVGDRARAAARELLERAREA